MQGKGAGPVNRVELESQVLCAALRQSFHLKDKIGSFTSVRELSHLFPDLLPPPEKEDENANSNKADYYSVLNIRPQTAANGVLASYLRAVRKFLRSTKVQDAKQEYHRILNAGFVLRKPRLRLSHDLVVSRRWLHEESRMAQITTSEITVDHREATKVLQEQLAKEVQREQPQVAPWAAGPPAGVAPPPPPPVPLPAAAAPSDPAPQVVYPLPPLPVASSEESTPPPVVAPTVVPPVPALPRSFDQEELTPQPPVQPFVVPPVPPLPVAASVSPPLPPVIQQSVSAMQSPETAVQGQIEAEPPRTATSPALADVVVAATHGAAQSQEFVPASLRPQPPIAGYVQEGGDRAPGRISKEATFVFDESALRKPTAGSHAAVPMIVQLLEAAQIISSLEVQALTAQMDFAPNIPVEKHILNAGYVSPHELASIKLGESLLHEGKITLAQFQVAIYDERTSGLRMAESLQVRGWLSVDVRNAIDEFHKKRQ